ncbi:MAG: peptidyl-prolyl cis-trans isomerase D [Gammaproteobacteria bacterium]|jgi:peptidyl-prolyl cis-trans isomerase D
MLGMIRDKASGWIAGIIVGALVLSFAFWGVSSYFGQGGDVTVATVNDSDINLKAFQQSFYTLRKQMQSVLQDDALTLEEEAFVKEETLKRLIEAEVVNQLIKDNGLRISNAKVVETIKELEYFKDDEVFDRDKYERSIISMGMEPVYFEAQLRMDLLSEQLQAGLSESLFVLESELNDVVRLKSQTRDLTYSILNLSSFADEGDVNDSEVEAFYKANPQRFVEAEKVKIEYLELDVNELAKTVTSDEESLRNYYNNNKDKYDVVEQRSVKKLFVKTGELTADDKIEEFNEEEKAKAKVVIESALAMVKEGRTFEEVIEKFSEEGKGALEFSEHAFMTKGVTDKAVEEFLFSSDEGEVSDVIKSKTGLNIVKVGEVKGGPKNIYETVAEQVDQDYKKSEAELQFFELSDQLTNLVYEHSDSLEVAAETVNREVLESDYFSRDTAAEGILSNSKIISTSFNPELISNGQNSEAIELADNHIVVLRVVDHKVATTKALDDVREDVISSIKMERAAGKITEAKEAITKQLKDGVAPGALSNDIEVEWTTVEKVTRDDVNVNRAVLRYAFQSGKPDDDKPIIISNRLGSGDYAIILVTAAYDGEVAEDDESSKKDDLELRRNRGTVEWQEFIQNARNNADVKVYKDNI